MGPFMKTSTIRIDPKGLVVAVVSSVLAAAVSVSAHINDWISRTAADVASRHGASVAFVGPQRPVSLLTHAPGGDAPSTISKLSLVIL